MPLLRQEPSAAGAQAWASWKNAHGPHIYKAHSPSSCATGTPSGLSRIQVICARPGPSSKVSSGSTTHPGKRHEVGALNPIVAQLEQRIHLAAAAGHPSRRLDDHAR
jgi:hypothetical protein